MGLSNKANSDSANSDFSLVLAAAELWKTVCQEAVTV